MKNILYFHGLDGYLTEDKRHALEKYGNVLADTIDYRSSKNIFFELLERYRSYRPDVIIGNSLGGLVAYWMSLAYDTPALLFNPALDYQKFTNSSLGIELSGDRRQYLQVVLGTQDAVVSPLDTEAYLNQHEKSTYAVHFYAELGHFIPIQEFSHELALFFDAISISHQP